MNTMSISEFKTHALKVLDGVHKKHESIVITKRGKPLVEIHPFQDENVRPVPGKLSETLLFEEDIVSPLGGDMWEVNQ